MLRATSVAARQPAAEARTMQYVGHALSEDIPSNERSADECINGAFKEHYCGHFVRVRGYSKALCYLILGAVALVVEQSTRLVTSSRPDDYERISQKNHNNTRLNVL
jgi:hypothetical protein